MINTPEDKKKRLKKVISQALDQLSHCRLCPRACGKDRTQNETGVCRTKDTAVVSSFMPHHGEEPPLSGTAGSGTIFFSHCNLRCVFCQNADISLMGEGQKADPDQIALAMILLQKKGCHNINFVTPTHVVPFILQAVDIALDMGLSIPLVYNTSGYETVETLDLLDGIIDIYMPDFKFWDPEKAKLACQAPDYPQFARQAVKAMHRQVGDLSTDARGIARSGLLIRHLVLPENAASTRKVMAFLSKEVSSSTRVNIMSQYRPMGKVEAVPWLRRPVTVAEFRDAVNIAREFGLKLIR